MSHLRFTTILFCGTGAGNNDWICAALLRKLACGDNRPHHLVDQRFQHNGSFGLGLGLGPGLASQSFLNER